MDACNFFIEQQKIETILFYEGILILARHLKLTYSYDHLAAHKNCFTAPSILVDFLINHHSVTLSCPMKALN